MTALEDGTYDVIVVEATTRADGTITLELAVSSGPHRGEVVAVNATHLAREWTELLATPGTLTVRNGEPRVTLD